MSDRSQKSDLYFFSALATVVGVVTGMWAALLHIRDIGTIEDEINFVNSWHSNMLVTIEDWNARYGRYGVHIDPNDLVVPEPQRTLEGPSFARRITLTRLWKLKEGKRNLASLLVVVAALGAICAVILVALGL